MTVQELLKTDEEIKEYHLKRLYELSKPGPGVLDFKIDGSVWRDGKPYTEPTTQEEDKWVERRMKGSAKSWERWFVGQYFTEEQKKELGLTDEDIAGKGIK
jgi:hypothetical protein